MLLYTSHIPHPLLCTCMYLYHVRQSAWHAHVWTVSQAPLLCQLLIPMHTMPLQPMIYEEVSLFTYIPSAKEMYCIEKESNIIGRVRALHSSSHVDWYMSVCSGVDGCEEQCALCLTWWVLVDHVSSAPRPVGVASPRPLPPSPSRSVVHSTHHW